MIDIMQKHKQTEPATLPPATPPPAAPSTAHALRPQRGARDKAAAWLDRYGPWVVVTGASDGIGRAFASQLAARGAHVVVVARRHAVLDDLAATLRATHGVQVQVVACDLGTAAGVQAVVDATAALDVGLVVNAAGFGTSGPLSSSDLDAELAMIDVNCRAVCALSHAFSARLSARGRGGLVLLSSLLAFQGVPRAANYAATKAYVQTLAEGLGRELAGAGVDVVACAPGPVRSGFADRAHMVMGNADSPDDVASGTLSSLSSGGTVRPGFLAKFLEASLSFLPRRGRVRALGVVMAGMTRHQGDRA